MLRKISVSPLPDGGFATMSTREMLIALGGLLAIVLGPIFFILNVAFGGIGLRGVAAVVVDIVLGFILLASVGVMRRNVLNGILLALISSVLLISLGGDAGVIGGLFSLIGGLLSLLVHYQIFLK